MAVCWIQLPPEWYKPHVTDPEWVGGERLHKQPIRQLLRNERNSIIVRKVSFIYLER